VLDARRAGLRVSILLDAIGSIDQHPGDAERALSDMVNAGAELAHGIITRTHDRVEGRPKPDAPRGS